MTDGYEDRRTASPGSTSPGSASPGSASPEPDPAEAGSARPSPRIGIGSYAYRYNIGFDGFEPPRKMDVHAFVREACRLSLDGIQLCENLGYASLDRASLDGLRRALAECGMFAELGMRDMSHDNVIRHIDIANSLGAKFIRVVAGTPSSFPESDRADLRRRLLGVFEQILPVLGREGIHMGLENHYDLPTKDLVSVVEEVDDPRVGLVFDTTNGLGFIERPEETLELVLPHIRSIHIKDYFVEKVEAGYLIRGAALGEGLLEYKSILSRVLDEKPDASIIVEMTIRRDSHMSAEETVAWELEQIEQSVRTLRAFVTRRVTAEGSGG